MDVTRIQPPTLPACNLAWTASGRGGRAWLVGGAVRDQLQGHAPRTTSRPISPLTRWRRPSARRSARQAPRGGHDQQRGRGGHRRDLRAEVAYSDRRRPDAVKFVEDLAWTRAVRTSRSMRCWSPPPGNSWIPAAVSDWGKSPPPLCRGRRPQAPRTRCAASHGPLRGERNLEIEAATAAAATAAAGEVATLSSERVFARSDMFTGRGRGRAALARGDRARLGAAPRGRGDGRRRAAAGIPP